ncbi:hypothetical protein [Microbacterium capsulatum]|uniref:Uncharacterized protein n=1 Tax=Microbacterium capsulatum TaxID=3041921 RepID=A0ABU0XE33_9MICO|nr:hypothetical protein [Microbacterium sp. ASV81]MDQ4213371.1 hypothetical protein [Microbacterium sp. ASV81]
MDEHTRLPQPTPPAPPMTPTPRPAARPHDGVLSGGHLFAAPRFGSAATRPTGPIPPAPRRRRQWPWIVAAVTAVAVGISGAVVTGDALLTTLIRTSSASSDAGPSGSSSPGDAYAEDVTSRLTRAMNANDRTAFIGIGEGSSAEHLAAIWDETKKLGWTLGVAESNSRTGPVQLAFNMGLGGFHAVSEARDGGSGGELLATFLYAATIRGTGSHARVVALDAMYPMPWDRGERIAVARGEHVALFADEDEGALVDARLAEAEGAAEDVLARPEWAGSHARLDGFVAYVTEDADDYAHAYGPGGADGTAGFCRTDVRPSQGSALIATGVATGDTLPGGALAFLGPGGLADGEGYVFAHEFAHYMQNTHDPAPYDRSGAGTDYIAVSEGYAESVAAQHVGYAAELFTTGDVRDAVLNGDIADVLAEHSFTDKDLSAMAYLTAGSYFYFLDQHQADYRMLLAADGTGPFAQQVVATMRPGLRIEDWKAWVAAQPEG